VNKLIDTGAVAAAYWVADESIDAFRRFHAALYAQQPEETATVFPDNGRLSCTHLAPPASGFDDRSVGPAVKVPTTVDVAC
jgi:protein-disulfide isomerase